MALGSAIGSIAAGAASAGLQGLLNRGGKSKSPSKQLGSFAPPNISAGGLTSGLNNNQITISPSNERAGLVATLAGLFPQQANFLAGLRSQVTPGFSALREAKLGQIESARQRATSNLRDNLSRRRIMGSSFAGDALSRAEAEFAQQKERVEAETFLQELEATQQLFQAEWEARQREFTTKLNELNLQADMAQGILSTISGDLAANARAKASLEAQEQAAAGRARGAQFGPLISGISKGIGSLVGGT